MKKIVMVMLGLLPLVSYAQKNEGITFAKESDWKAVIQKAQEEHKNIFVDAFATWCGPCKMMDREVYTDDEVGLLMNANFIAIKVQMDSTKNDNELIKNWYKDAASFKNYISAYPTFLFFSPEGKLIGQNMGYKRAEDFITMVKELLDPKGNYIGQINAFEQGALNDRQLLKLAFSAQSNNDRNLAMKIAKVYKAKFIDLKKPKELLSPDFPKFLHDFDSLFRFNDPFIKYLYANSKSSDRIMGIYNGYTNGYFEYLVKRDFITPVVYPNGKASVDEPNWTNLQGKVSHIVDARVAKRLILDKRIAWNRDKNNWPVVVQFELARMNLNGLDTSADVRSKINDISYDVIFMHSNCPAVLKKGITYVEAILKYESLNYHFIDTYANLLYKLGFKERAIEQAERALSIAQKDNFSNKDYYIQMLDKMKKGQPTWREISNP